MRTSLREIEQLENWVFKRGEPSERLVTEARLLTSNELKAQLSDQRAAYEMIRFYGRANLRTEIKTIEHKLFHTTKHRSFQKRIQSIFSKLK